MKTTKFLQPLSFLSILIIAISCRSSRSYTSVQYPPNPLPPTQTTTNTYPVQTNNGNLPPGQAKKIYGGQSAKTYAPGQRKKYPLVIVYTNDIVINRYSDGRYYCKNTAGYIYWKGDDGRYYIDEKHLKDVEYEESDYDEWKFKGQKNNYAHGPKGKDQEKIVKENQKTNDAKYMANVKEQKGMGQNQRGKGNDQKEKDQFNQKEKDNGQNGKDQFNPKVKDNNQKEKDQIDQKAKDENKKEKDQADQVEKDNGQKEKDQIDQKAKDENKKVKDQVNQDVKDNGQKEKDQADKKAKDNNQKVKDQIDSKAKDENQKVKDQTDQKAKDDNLQKGKTKSKDKA